MDGVCPDRGFDQSVTRSCLQRGQPGHPISLKPSARLGAGIGMASRWGDHFRRGGSIGGAMELENDGFGPLHHGGCGLRKPPHLQKIAVAEPVAARPRTPFALRLHHGPFRDKRLLVERRGLQSGNEFPQDLLTTGRRNVRICNFYALQLDQLTSPLGKTNAS